MAAAGAVPVVVALSVLDGGARGRASSRPGDGLADRAHRLAGDLPRREFLAFPPEPVL